MNQPGELHQCRVLNPLELQLMRGVAGGVGGVGEHCAGGGAGGPHPGAARHAALVTAPRVGGVVTAWTSVLSSITTLPVTHLLCVQDSTIHRDNHRWMCPIS